MKVLRRILVAAFFVSVAIPALAENGLPACAGRNLYADLKQADPQGYAEVEKAAAAKQNSGPLYWKIIPPNGAKPSYLLGTAHVTDERIATPTKALIDRIAKSRVAVFEISSVGDRMAMGAAMMADTARTQMPDGKTLWDVIPDDREAAIRANPIIAMIPPDRLDKFQPWLVSTVLSSPLCEQMRQERKFVLDAALAQQAQIAHLDIEGLETLQEQLKVLSSMSLADQATMLVNQTSMGIPAEDSFQTVVELYLARKVTVMEPLMLYLGKKKGVAQKDSDAAFMKNFIDKRNINMAERSRRYIDKGAAFIAVGALHLYGEVGVVELLRKAEYKVTAEEL